jgi:hypothetical protein
MSEETLKRADIQVAAANISMRFVERSLTPLESVAVTASYRIQTNTLLAKHMNSFLDRLKSETENPTRAGMRLCKSDESSQVSG